MVREATNSQFCWASSVLLWPLLDQEPSPLTGFLAETEARRRDGN